MAHLPQSDFSISLSQTIKSDGNWTLFLDRDGVLNHRLVGAYVRRPEEFDILPGVLEGLRICSEIFARIVVVTNQQGIGKGLMTEKALEKIHRLFPQRSTGSRREDRPDLSLRRPCGLRQPVQKTRNGNGAAGKKRFSRNQF